MLPAVCFNDTATTEIYTLSLHDALPICRLHVQRVRLQDEDPARTLERTARREADDLPDLPNGGEGALGQHLRRSEEHTSELQSRQYLVCRLLLEKKIQPLPRAYRSSADV